MAEQIEGYRLSPQQKRLWQLQRDLPPLRAQCAVGLEGSLKLEVLREALEATVGRHEILRTAFQSPPGITLPIQVINETSELVWRVVDWGELSRDEEEVRVAALFEETESQPHDFERGLVLSATLIKLSLRRYLLHLSLPSLYADAWSLRNLVREAADTYAARLEGVEGAGEVVQYLQFSEWQNDLLEDENAPLGQAYWRGQDVSAALPPAFTFARKPSGREGARRKTLDLRVEATSAAEVDALAERLEADAEAVLLACWQALLWRVTGQSSVVVGHVSAGRKLEELYDSLGLFAKSLPVRCRFGEGTTFVEAVRQIAESSRTASEWQEWFDWQAVEPAAEVTPRYPAVGFRFDYWPSSHLADGVSFTLRGQRVRVDRHDLALELVRHDDTLLAQFTYEPALYGEADVRLLAEQFQTLLHSALANPEAEVSTLEMLSEDERRRLVVEFNATEAAYPREKLLHQLFEEQGRRTPDAEAIVYRDERLTYVELDGRANQLARHLAAVGVGPETIVAVACERSPELVVALLGILKAGAAYLPLDLSYPPERLAFMLEDAAVPVLLAQERLQALLPMCDARVVWLDSNWHEIAAQSTDEAPARALPDNPAYVIYTSGSTGRPKGVVVPHRGLVNYLSWCTKAYAVGEHGGSVVHSPIGFDLTVTTLFSPLLAGRSVLLVPEEQGVEGLKDALQTVGHFGLAKLTPSHLEVLNQLLPREAAADSVAAFILGGEALWSEQLAFWREHSPATRLINEYGPTEAVVGCCIYEVPAEAPATGPVPIGRPISNARIYLLDSRLRPTPTYVAGELYIGGDCLARGYLNRPDLTAEKFIPDPFSDEPGARLYRTGDLARHLPGGQVEYLGRADQQVKIRGFRVELGEIEAVLGQHPGVREAVVALREETNDQRLVAYVVPAGAEAPTAGELRSHLQGLLPEYMLPAAFVTLEELPLTPNGKVDRRALPAPEGLRPQLAAAYVAPQTETERIISAIWQDVLQIEKVGIYDNFFDLGGHSLLMVRVNRRLREEFDREVSMIDLFRYPTVSALVEFLSQEPQEEMMAAAAAADSRSKVQARKDLAAAQKELRERRRQLKARKGA